VSRVVGVTGATGVIGRAFVQLARERGYEVRQFARQASGAQPLDLTSSWIDPRLFEGCDVVVHLAARLPSGGDLQTEAHECWRTNALGTLKLLQTMHEAGVKRLIQATAANAYAAWCKFPDELAPLYPQTRTCYLSSKVQQELFAHSFGAEHDIAVASLRISSPYGPDQRNTVARMAATLLQGRSVQLDNGGTFGADFIFIQDIAEAILLIDGADAIGAWNVASGKRHTINEVVEQLARLTDARTSQIVRKEFGGGETGFPAIDISKISALGFLPTAFDQGLEATVAVLRSIDSRRAAVG
jgi:UDP-glucose 4-epimerase